MGNVLKYDYKSGTCSKSVNYLSLGFGDLLDSIPSSESGVTGQD